MEMPANVICAGHCAAWTRVMLPWEEFKAGQRRALLEKAQMGTLDHPIAKLQCQPGPSVGCRQILNIFGVLRSL